VCVQDVCIGKMWDDGESCGIVWYGGDDEIKGKDKIVDEGGCRVLP
jgi:hypothetical protein